MDGRGRPTMEMEEERKRYTPKEISKLLGIHGSTLRHYSEMLEKEGYIFERNHLHYRQYTGQDFNVLQKIMEIKINRKLLVKKAVQQAIMWASGVELLVEKNQQDYQLEIANTDSNQEHPEGDNFTAMPSQAQLLIQLQNQMERQSELLTQVWGELTVTKEQNAKLMEAFDSKQIDAKEEERIRQETEEMNRNIRYIRERMEAKQEVAMTSSKRTWQFWKK